jgi:putative DNA primase/helicase
MECHNFSTETIARAPGGHPIGSAWMAPCPAHDDRTPSLSIRDADDGKLLVRCHAGCDQARVIAALRGLGLWPKDGPRPLSGMVRRAPVEHKPEPDDTRRNEAALAIWKFAGPAQGTLVEVYLTSRGIRPPAPVALRFHPGLKHPSGGMWPAMVALVTRGLDSKPLAIHRTYLAREGIGKAPVEWQKMMLGPCRGGCGDCLLQRISDGSWALGIWLGGYSNGNSPEAILYNDGHLIVEQELDYVTVQTKIERPLYANLPARGTA